MGHRNAEKASLLYRFLDESSFYQTRVAANARSFMNVPFYLPDDRLYEPFLRGAQDRGLLGLKGHKAVGGLRASLYNAMPIEGVRALLAWMPIPLQALEPCIPSRGVRRRQKKPWFSRIELPPPTHSTASMAIA